MPLGSRRRVILKDFPDTENSGGLRERLSQIRANLASGVDPQTVNAILFDEGPNPIAVRFAAGVIFSVEANLVVPHPALLLAHCLNRMHSMNDIVTGAVV